MQKGLRFESVVDHIISLTKIGRNRKSVLFDENLASVDFVSLFVLKKVLFLIRYADFSENSNLSLESHFAPTYLPLHNCSYVTLSSQNVLCPQLF